MPIDSVCENGVEVNQQNLVDCWNWGKVYVIDWSNENDFALVRNSSKYPREMNGSLAVHAEMTRSTALQECLSATFLSAYKDLSFDLIKTEKKKRKKEQVIKKKLFCSATSFQLLRELLKVRLVIVRFQD